MHATGDWLYWFFGLSGSGAQYAFWSGAGSDIGEAAIIVGLVHWYRSHTCHVDSPRFCWRWGAHPVEGTPYRACKKHHPTVPEEITVQHIARSHRSRSSDR